MKEYAHTRQFAGHRAPLGSLLLVLATSIGAAAQEPLQLASPDGRNVASIGTQEGRLFYAVERDGRSVVLPSRLGFEFRNAPPLSEGLHITGSSRNTVDQTWTQPWGVVEEVRDHHNELRITVEETTAPRRHFDVVFRAFDDGIAFRYEVPEQPGLGAYEMTAELTEFTLATDGRAWWIPAGQWNRYEFLYSASPVSRLPVVHTPLTIEMQDGLHVVIHEANLVDYAAMNLRGTDSRTLRTYLSPWADSVRVRGNTPFVSPWRTIEIADRAADLLPATMALNLNPPSRIEDTSWIEPMKYVGIWWHMHINTHTWHSGPQHGATTEHTREMIDFAADNGFGGVLVEGWNVGWDGDWMANAERFSFTQPYPDFDLPALARYARERSVTLIGHHETSMGVKNYERQME
ncbi:MAG: glycoside hydrolase family 97 N-terminal domain-containing protein, partial [Longimicrobiales bacterium]